MSILTPSAWEGISTVTVVIFVVIIIGTALKQGWLVLGPAHRELLRVKDDVIAAKDDAITHERGRSQEDQRIIATQASTIAEQRVAGELTAHIIQAIREATGNAGAS